jgi:hypothetical protein
MNKVVKITLIVLASLILVGGALAAGWFLGEKRVQTVSTFQTSDTITTDNKPFNYPGMMRNHITVVMMAGWEIVMASVMVA